MQSLQAAREVADPGSPDPVEMLMRREAVETAVSRFVELPTVQRSVVILKDVLDQSLAGQHRNKGLDRSNFVTKVFNIE